MNVLYFEKIYINFNKKNKKFFVDDLNKNWYLNK